MKIKTEKVGLWMDEHPYLANITIVIGAAAAGYFSTKLILKMTGMDELIANAQVNDVDNTRQTFFVNLNPNQKAHLHVVVTDQQ
jgi:hypothetical protein